MPGLIDALLILVFIGVAYMVASEGVWGAMLMALTVIFAGLFAMNFFEPAANFLESTIGLTGDWSYRTDFLALVGLFAAGVGLLRLMAYKISETDFVLHDGFNDIGRWIGGLLTGWVTMAFLLTALHTAPVPREFIGFTPERKNLLNVVAPDRQWLGFTQYCSEHAFANYENVMVDGEPRIVRRVFDGPYVAVPGQDSQTRWPSFPMRYAIRREQHAGTTNPQPIPAAPRPAAKPGDGPANPGNGGGGNDPGLDF